MNRNNKETIEKHDLITYEQAIALERFGFEESTHWYYDQDECLYFGGHYANWNGLSHYQLAENWYSAPTIYQVQKWIKSEYKRYIYVIPKEYENNKFIWRISNYNIFCTWGKQSKKEYDNPEEALYDCIDEIINMINNK